MEAIVAMRWTGVSRWALAWCVGLQSLCLSAKAGAQQDPATSVIGQPQTTLTDELASLAGRAAQIFVGQVISVKHQGGVVEIAFSVDQALAGSVGSTFTLHEWTGLWPQGQVRYTLGQRALVFLHAASTAGFASPVDGAEGVVPVIVQGAQAPQLLDVRRLAAALLRAPGTPLPTEADGAILLSDAMGAIARARTAAVTLDVTSTSPARHLDPPLRLPLRMHGGAAQDPELPASPAPQPGQFRRPLIMATGANTESGVTYAQR